MRILGVICLLLSAFLGWLFWFCLAPYLRGLVPVTSEWAPLSKIAITIFVGWAGGIVLPLVTFVWGVVLLILGKYY